MLICNLFQIYIRSFSNRAQTIANRGSPGQHLGLKVSDGEIIGSNIIICRQRGFCDFRMEIFDSISSVEDKLVLGSVCFSSKSFMNSSLVVGPRLGSISPDKRRRIN
eukprot:TRINITY_DN9237_c0_g2_i1.p1 TRINITY_DN9237_c0_g2~~TRINITY_DN9237_c0_g2_i1.p1  ORF type:complete len:107 (+),score=1.72 TRINITY_DN9237_c0_g2_i1:8-328(+)